MSYRVEYGWNPKQAQRGSCFGFRRFLFCAGFFVLFLTLVTVFWSEGREVLLQLLFPGDAEAAWNAAVLLADDLMQGIPLNDAVESFCREIIQLDY